MPFLKAPVFLTVMFFLLACGLTNRLLSSDPPTPTPVPSAEELIEALQDAGLEVADVQPIGELPKGGVDGLKFYTPSLCDGCSSMVIIFNSEANALETKVVMEQAGKANESFKFFTYHSGRVLLRMGGLIDEGQAARYARALQLD